MTWEDGQCLDTLKVRVPKTGAYFWGSLEKLGLVNLFGKPRAGHGVSRGFSSVGTISRRFHRALVFSPPSWQPLLSPLPVAWVGDIAELLWLAALLSYTWQYFEDFVLLLHKIPITTSLFTSWSWVVLESIDKRDYMTFIFLPQFISLASVLQFHSYYLK